MANEAKVVTLLGNKGDPIEYVVNVGSTILKGTLMYISGASVDGAMGCKATDGVGSRYFAGIAAEEFASGTQYGPSGGGLYNKLPCWTNGIFEMETSDQDQILVGAMCVTSDKGPNFIGSATSNQDGIAEAGEIVGQALSTALVSTAIPVKVCVGKFR